MAVPKNKISKSKTNSRFANWKLKATGLVECPQCHELIKSHMVCPKCGYYKGTLVKEPNQKAE